MTTQIRRAIMASRSKPTATLANYGDIVYLDAADERKVVPSGEWNTSLGTPIGVIAVPTGFAPDGIARFVSLSYVTSTSGISGAYRKLIWGNGTNTGLNYYDKVPIVSNASSYYPNGNYDGFLPSDNFSGAESSTDPLAFYFGDTPYIPSPYKITDGVESLNPKYIETLPDGNALSDFDGYGNTQTQAYLAQTAAVAASNSLVKGAKWYLPSAGELGFLIARLKTINNVIVNILGRTKIKDDLIWSSTEDDATYVFLVNPSDGQVTSTSRGNASAGVRPFAKLDD